MKIEQRENSVWIGQPAYLKNLLETYRMQDCKLVDTHVSISSKLNKASDEDECVDQKNTSQPLVPGSINFGSLEDFSLRPG